MQALIGRSRRLPRTPLLLFISTSVLASGEDCVTRHEFEALREETAALRAQVAALKEQQRQKQVGVDTAPVSLSVSPLGGMTRAGRQLSAATCCRWTPGGTCNSGDVTSGCTELHEYLEHKTTTHEFAAIETCLLARSRVVPTPPRPGQRRGPPSRATTPRLRSSPRRHPPDGPRAQRGRGRRARSAPRPPCGRRVVPTGPEAQASHR